MFFLSLEVPNVQLWCVAGEIPGHNETLVPFDYTDVSGCRAQCSASYDITKLRPGTHCMNMGMSITIR